MGEPLRPPHSRGPAQVFLSLNRQHPLQHPLFGEKLTLFNVLACAKQQKKPGGAREQGAALAVSMTKMGEPMGQGRRRSTKVGEPMGQGRCRSTQNGKTTEPEPAQEH